jgi:hypothetical protein
VVCAPAHHHPAQQLRNQEVYRSRRQAVGAGLRYTKRAKVDKIVGRATFSLIG